MKTPRNIARLLIVSALLFAAAYTFAVGLANGIRNTTPAAFFPVAIAGLGLSVGLALTRFKAAWAWAIIFLFGFGFIFLHNGQLGDPLLAFFNASLKYESQRARWVFDSPPPDAREVESAYAEFASRAASAGGRVRRWTEGLVYGDAPDDPLGRAVAWSIPVLFASAWLGWSLVRRGRALEAMLPAIALLAFVTNYSGAAAFTLQIQLLVFLLLLALHEGRTDLHGDALQATVVLSVALVFVAGFVPSVSAREILNAEKERARQQRNDAAAEALGLERAAGEDDRYRSSGLPNERLIGGAPNISHDIAFTVRTGELPPMPRLPRDERPPRYYWRSITYDTYTGRGWAITIRESRDEKASALLMDWIPTGYRLLHLEVDKPIASSRLFWTGNLMRINQPIRAVWRTLPNSRTRSQDPLRGADLIAATSDAASYRVDAILPVVTLEQLRAAPNEIPAWAREAFLSLPPSVPKRVHDLARELTASQPTAYDKARAIESYLRRFPYTLDVPLPPTDRDLVDYFLFDLQTGYCDYYATAMVVLARAAGLPARLVSGYASGEYVPEEARYIVRESDAHSWVEIYFTGIGWIEFEPTANRPLIPHVEETIIGQPDISFGNVEAGASSETRQSIFQSLLKIPPGIFIAAILLCACIGLTANHHRERRRQNAPVKTITEIYKTIYRMGRKLISESARSHTPFTFAEALEKRLELPSRSELVRNFIAPAKEELSILTDIYVRAIYSPNMPTRKETIQAMKIWRKLVWRLWVKRIISTQ